jgi:predicted nucleotidyltransferase
MERVIELQPLGMDGVLTTQQSTVAGAVLREEEAHREHLVVYLSGAHAYGFPSPDSDLDLKAIHIAPTASLLGFAAPAPTVDRAEIVSGVEIDYTSNELGHALSGILRGNGNFLERVLGRTVPHASPLLHHLRPLVERSLSRRVHRHYRGFALNQRGELAKKPTAKKLLYVLRTCLTGIHLLGTGRLETDMTRIMSEYGFDDAAALVKRKLAGERVALDGAQVARWQPRVDALFEQLDRARETSLLPEAPPNEAELRDWLLDVRRARFV